MSRKPGRWSSLELARLRELFPRGGVSHAARLLRRSEAAVRTKVDELYSRRLRRGRWHDEELDLLRQGWGVLTAEELVLLLARSTRDVHAMAEALRQARREGAWDEGEQRRLKRLYATRSVGALEVCLSRSAEDIVAMARELCLGRDRKRRVGSGRMPRWRSEEVAYLQRVYADRDNEDIARELGRSTASVTNKAHQLKLRKSAVQRSRTAIESVSRRYRPAPDGPVSPDPSPPS